jgi:hypothetical protein
MSRTEKGIHRLIISLLFSLVTWVIIDNLIVEVSAVRYIFIELTVVLCMKFSIFTIQKLRLDDPSRTGR